MQNLKNSVPHRQHIEKHWLKLYTDHLYKHQPWRWINAEQRSNNQTKQNTQWHRRTVSTTHWQLIYERVKNTQVHTTIKKQWDCQCLLKQNWLLCTAEVLNNPPCAHEFYKQQHCSIFTCQETRFLPLEKFYITTKHVIKVWMLGQLHLLIQHSTSFSWFMPIPPVINRHYLSFLI